MTRNKFLVKRVTFSQRKDIESLLYEGTSKRQVCQLAGIAMTTLLRELKRCEGPYKAQEAQLHCDSKKVERDEKSQSYRNEMRQRIETLEIHVIKLYEKIADLQKKR